MHPPIVINEHTHIPLLLGIPNTCVFLIVPSISCTEVALLEYPLGTAHDACNSKDVNALTFQVVHPDTF